MRDSVEVKLYQQDGELYVFDGRQLGTALDELHRQARLYGNFFLPCFKVKSKTRVGAKVSKKYEPPATPYERLLTNARMTEPRKVALRELLSDIRVIQRRLTTLEVSTSSAQVDAPEPNIDRLWKALPRHGRLAKFARPTENRRRGRARGALAWIRSRTRGSWSSNG